MTDKDLQDILFNLCETIEECDVHTFGDINIPTKHKGLRLTFTDGGIFQLLIFIEKFPSETYQDISST